MDRDPYDRLKSRDYVLMILVVVGALLLLTTIWNL